MREKPILTLILGGAKSGHVPKGESGVATLSAEALALEFEVIEYLRKVIHNIMLGSSVIITTLIVLMLFIFPS